MCVVVGCIDGLRVSVDQHPAETSLPPLGIPDVILQTPILWKHIEQNVNLATSMLYGTPNERAQHVETARLINSRFAFGKPNEHIAAAGVILHGLKKFTPWEAPEMLDTPPIRREAFAASLVNVRAPYSWSHWSGHRTSNERGSAGLIISPQAGASSLKCSFPGDAKTDQLLNSCSAQEISMGCVPGCVNNTHQWCERDLHNRLTTLGRKNEIHSCAFPPNQLKLMMALQEHFLASVSCRSKSNQLNVKKCWGRYNEVSLDTKKLTKLGPEAIEAIYFVSDDASMATKRWNHTDGFRKTVRHATGLQHAIAKAFNTVLPVLRVRNFQVPAPFEYFVE
eukprot:gnl/TRDRNA2_/TRDRNA2_175492_c0_seq1.p1 gnl/TRDRNA2_/TRDRNA2_175492_c0~~gnl/TRDRNA2_/TRDRNA2_175492_c0_seq1.p1  ORF type:complete len:373 (+),score=11.68 gnl/TRDRNA2_/TRDRNA2_175492_c0_seq1:110-1120(+)